MQEWQTDQDPDSVDRHLRRIFAWPVSASGEIVEHARVASRSRRKPLTRRLIAAATAALVITALSVIAVSRKARAPEPAATVWSEGGLTVVVTRAGSATISVGRDCAGSGVRRMLIVVE
jgi:hypothetical protein